jgi:uncharacterized membrane protein (DUF485 family)
MSNAPQSALRGQSREHTGKAASFGGISRSAVRLPPRGPDFVAIRRSATFRHLNRRVKWFVFSMTALFLCWYLGYVVLAAYEPAFMARPLLGDINVGLVMGVLQFVTTIGISALYVRFAARHIDPRVEEIRREAEGMDL